ncbi:MAG: hypothetical protein JO006_17880 [Paucibacter sp.]|nr:hypothetical protein [Roseateles sp.]
MQTFASIASRAILIAGQPNSGWSGCDEGTPGSFELDFALQVTSDGGKGYLLVYKSLDGQYAGDTWHQTIEEAYASAEEQFGIERGEWAE